VGKPGTYRVGVAAVARSGVQAAYPRSVRPRRPLRDVAGRVAALCATAEQRIAVTERVAHAVSMERAIVAGLAPMDGGVEKLLAEITGHLRALLRDVLCGHLDSDLRSVADQLLAESGAAA